jgi:hypothetical protein
VGVGIGNPTAGARAAVPTRIHSHVVQLLIVAFRHRFSHALHVAARTLEQAVQILACRLLYRSGAALEAAKIRGKVRLEVLQREATSADRLVSVKVGSAIYNSMNELGNSIIEHLGTGQKHMIENQSDKVELSYSQSRQDVRASSFSLGWFAPQGYGISRVLPLSRTAFTMRSTQPWPE